MKKATGYTLGSLRATMEGEMAEMMHMVPAGRDEEVKQHCHRLAGRTSAASGKVYEANFKAQATERPIVRVSDDANLLEVGAGGRASILRKSLDPATIR